MEQPLKRTWASPDDYAELRKYVDGDDPFMVRPAIIASRIGRSEIPPEIADSNGGINTPFVRTFLRKKFPYARKSNPKCECHWCEHRSQKYMQTCDCRECRETVLMIRWWTITWELWGEHKTATHIERDHGYSRGTVGFTVQQIKRALRGTRLDGKQRTGRPRGRPRKVQEVSVAA
jgi:hypothetical protein